MKAKIIAFANQKGGVAKTTTVLTVGKELAKQGKKVLLVDMDAQATLTQILGVELSREQKTVADYIGIMGKSLPFDEVVIKFDDLDLLSSNISLFNAEKVLISKNNNGNVFRREIDKVRNLYDYILLDCPPSLGLLMTNALLASDYIVMPMKPEMASAMSFGLFADTLMTLGNDYEKNFDIAGILLTMTEERTKSFKEVKDLLVKQAGEFDVKVFDTTIRRSVRCSDDVGKGINVADTQTKVGNDYKMFVKELLSVIGE